MAPLAPPAPTGLNLETYGRKTLTAAPGLSEPGTVGPCPPSILRDKLTLFQPGGQVMPTTLPLAPPNFQTCLRPCLLQAFCTKALSRVYQNGNGQFFDVRPLARLIIWRAGDG